MQIDQYNSYRKSKYKKKSFDLNSQITKLSSHGLLIDDMETAKKFLQNCSYFRFSGYAYYFKDGGEFHPGVKFSDIINLYEFDDEVRKKLIEALRIIEIWMRGQIGDRLGAHDPFAHRLPTMLRRERTVWTASSTSVRMSYHAEWLADYTREEKRSQGDFVSHFRKKYGPHLPVWAATEIMSFGNLSRLFPQLPEEDCSLIAMRAGLVSERGKGDYPSLANWINHLRYVRNCCAHYSRIWNRVFDTSLSTPKISDPCLPDFNKLPHKLYKTIVAIHFLLCRIDPSTAWAKEIIALIKSFTELNHVNIGDMGFPEGWEESPIWSDEYRQDIEISDLVDRVTEIDCIRQSQLVKLFSPERNERGRKDFLKYLRGKGAIFSYLIGEVRYYPKFQFEETFNFVNESVADVNEVLYKYAKESKDLNSDKFMHDWWLGVNGKNGFSDAPIREIDKNPKGVKDAAERYVSSLLSL